MQNTEQLIAQGNDADRLLRDESFVRVVNHLIDQCSNNMMTSKPEDREIRENYYFQSRGLQEIVSTLNQMVAVRDQILTNTNED